MSSRSRRRTPCAALNSVDSSSRPQLSEWQPDAGVVCPVIGMIQTALEPVSTSGQDLPSVPGAGFRRDAAWALSLLLVGVGAKLWLIGRWGSPLPYLDQWPAEAIDLFIPWFQHRFSPAILFAPHNEHRILFTRLCELGLLLLNGQWDARLEMVFNAFLHAAAVAGFGWLMASLLGRRYWPLLWFLLVLDLALPFAWENTLWGFQSQFYFLFIFSMLTLWLLALSEPLSVRWWWGAAASVAALFTMASGFLAAAAVGALALAQVMKQPAARRRHLVTVGWCAAITLAGLLLKPDIPEHHVFQAHSAGDFLTALGRNLAWPWVVVPLYAPFNLLPLAALGWVYLRSDGKPAPAGRMLLGIGLWAILQCLAVAFSRGAGGTNPAWRYMDPFSFLAIANCLSICLLLTRHRSRLRFVPLWYAAAAVWVFGCVTGLWFLTDRAVNTYIPETALDQADQLKTARAFMATGDADPLRHQRSSAVIVPNVDAVVWLLRRPDLRRVLPACLRDSLKIIPDSQTNKAFIPNDWHLNKPDPPTEVSWGSYSQNGAGAARGGFVSLPIRQSTLPYLEIPVAGDLGGPGLSLELVDVASGRIFPVTPPAVPGGTWLNTYVPAPQGEFKMVAAFDTEMAWFAFKEPREVGRLSYWAMRTAEGWKFFLAAGLALLVLNLASLLSSRPMHPVRSGRP
jgi:hypothetical protein